MKTNLKSGNALVRFLLAHGEKIGIAGMLACAGMLVWSSIGRDSLGPEKQPDKLVSQASNALQKVNAFTWDRLPEEEKKIARPISLDAMKAVKPGDYPRYDLRWNRPIVASAGLRTDPLLLAAEDLEVSSDSGLWAVGDRETADRKRFEMIKKSKRAEQERRQELDRKSKNDDRKGNNRGNALYGGGMGGLYGGRSNRNSPKRKAKSDKLIVLQSRAGVKLTGVEDVQEVSWVTVLARVPIRQQYQLYDDAFRNARGYVEQRDVPDYIGYVVERAEVTDAGPGDWKKIAGVVRQRLEAKLKSWPATSQEVIDSKYSHPILTHPLPPLLLREWDEKVTHSKMPLPSSERGQMFEEEEPEDQPEGKPGENTDIFADATTDKRLGTFQGERGGEVYRGQGRLPAGFGGGYGGGPDGGPDGGYGGGYGGMGGPGYGGGGYGGLGRNGEGIGQVSLGAFAYDGQVSHILLRYFDHNVVPGRRYRYRFQLVFANPNYKVREKYLDKSVVERCKKWCEEGKNPKYRRAEWSEPSPVVGVPMPGRVYVAGAKEAKENNFSDEPSAKLLIRDLNREHAAEIAMDDWFSRGSVINVRGKAKVIWVDRFEAEDEVEFDFRTGTTLLDFSGGQKLSRKNSELTAPSRALLMDPAGRLTIHTELEDSEEVSEYELTLESASDSRNMQGGYGGGYGGGYDEGPDGGPGY